MTDSTQSEDRLLKAAMTVFSHKGYASSSVSDIIKKAGVARGTFYLYFNSKKNAFERVLSMVLQSIEALAVDDSANEFSSPSGIYRRINESYTAFLTLFKENSGFARILLTEATGLDKGFDRQLERHYDAHRYNVRRFLEGVKKSGFARDFNIEVMAEAIIGWSERCARIFASEDRGIPVDILAQALTDFEFTALCTVPLSEVKGE